jgi:hypothetical protein
MKNANPSLSTVSDADHFLQACVDYEDEVEWLSRLSSKRENGEKLLRAALVNHDDYDNPAFLNRSVEPVLRRLASEVLSRGVHKASVDALLVSLLLEEEVWANALIAALGRKQITKPETIGWMVLQVAARSQLARSPSSRTLIIDTIRALRSYGNGYEHIAGQIATVCGMDDEQQPGAGNRGGGAAAAAAAAPRSLSDLQGIRGAGGRHDNDKVNFRDVSIVPTPSELLHNDPFLPLAAGTPGNPVESEATTLDRAFRLLREEFVAPLREELSQVNNSQRSFNRARILHYFSGKPHWEDPVPPAGAAAAASAGGYQRAPSRMIDKGHLCVTFDHFQGGASRKASFWDDKKRQLGFQALVCFVVKGKITCFGVVCERDSGALAKQQPRIGIAPTSDADLRKALQLQMYDVEFTMVQVDASFFACEPIMRSLQRLTRVPFAEELVHYHSGAGQPLAKPEYTDPRYLRMMERLEHEPLSVVCPSAMAGVQFDPSQEAAVLRCLRQRVALTQGPPGTGSWRAPHTYTRTCSWEQ